MNHRNPTLREQLIYDERKAKKNEKTTNKRATFIYLNETSEKHKKTNMKRNIQKRRKPHRHSHLHHNGRKPAQEGPPTPQPTAPKG